MRNIPPDGPCGSTVANLIVELALTRAALEKSLLTLEHLAAMDAIFKRRRDFWDAQGQGSKALYMARKILQLAPTTPPHERHRQH
jgi:hypothetical protein